MQLSFGHVIDVVSPMSFYQAKIWGHKRFTVCVAKISLYGFTIKSSSMFPANTVVVVHDTELSSGLHRSVLVVPPLLCILWHWAVVNLQLPWKIKVTSLLCHFKWCNIFIVSQFICSIVLFFFCYHILLPLTWQEYWMATNVLLNALLYSVPYVTCVLEQGHVTHVLLVHHSVLWGIVGSASLHQPLLLPLVLFTEVFMQTSALLSILFPPADATYMTRDRGPSPSQFHNCITQCFETFTW